MTFNLEVGDLIVATINVVILIYCLRTHKAVNSTASILAAQKIKDTETIKDQAVEISKIKHES